MKKVMDSFPSISISLSTAGKLRSFLGKFFCFILVIPVYYNDFISALILLHIQYYSILMFLFFIITITVILTLISSKILIIIILIITCHYHSQYVPYHLHILCFFISVPLLLRGNPFHVAMLFLLYLLLLTFFATAIFFCYYCYYLILLSPLYIYIYSKHFPKNKKTNKQIHKYYKLST